MRSFQAANPDSVLEDFVQWYSPRDWIPPKDGAKSSLSQRMNENGNLWKTTWMVGSFPFVIGLLLKRIFFFFPQYVGSNTNSCKRSRIII